MTVEHCCLLTESVFGFNFTDIRAVEALDF